MTAWTMCMRVQAQDGSSYEGDWHTGRKHGQGIYVSPDNLTYTGFTAVVLFAFSLHYCVTGRASGFGTRSAMMQVPCVIG